MRTQVIAGKTVLTVTFKDEEGDKESVCVVKLGRRVRVTTASPAHIKRCLTGAAMPTWSYPSGRVEHYDVNDIDKNVEVGPKTLARVIEDALVYGHSQPTKVDTSYALDTDTVAFELAGANRLRFKAPCGQIGFLTRNEARKLVAALRSL